MHWFPLHVSMVHALLSLQTCATSVGVLATVVHPESGKHDGFRQMSDDVQAAPRSSTSQAEAVALHVYRLHKVDASQTSSGTSAQKRFGDPVVCTCKIQLSCKALGRLLHPLNELTQRGMVQNVAGFVHGNSSHAHTADRSDVTLH